MVRAIAQCQTELRAERQMDGIQKARAREVHLGRKKRLTPQQCATPQQRRLDSGLITALVREPYLSKASVYRYLTGCTHRGGPYGPWPGSSSATPTGREWLSPGDAHVVFHVGEDGMIAQAGPVLVCQ
jgi:hypothetical protein